MAITIKNEEQLELMRRAGQMLARVHKELAGELHEGMTTMDVDRIVEEMIMSFGGYPNFKGYNGFPAAACVSVNDEIVHGIPSDKRYLKSGDIVTIDTGVLYKGFHSDAARTHAIGEISDDAKKLIKVTEDSFFEAIKNVKPGNHIVDIGRVVQQIALNNGYSVVRTLTGHGIGEDLHEAPNIPNYRTLLKGARMRKGMTLAIEPMINMGNYDVRLLDNNWTYATADGSLSSHYENTVAVTDDGCEILTLTPEEIEARLGDASGNVEKNRPKGDIKEAIRVIPDEFQTAALATEDRPDEDESTEDKANSKRGPKRKPRRKPEGRSKGKPEAEEKTSPEGKPKGKPEAEEKKKPEEKPGRKTEAEEKTKPEGKSKENTEAEEKAKPEEKSTRKTETEEKTKPEGISKAKYEDRFGETSGKDKQEKGISGEKQGKERLAEEKPEKERAAEEKSEKERAAEEKPEKERAAEEKPEKEGAAEEKPEEKIPENDKPYQTLTPEEKKKRRDALFEDE